MANEKVDVVIVGAGASGSVYASVLAKQGKKVVLLESGPDWQLNDLISSDFWGRRVKPAGPPFLLEGKNPYGYVYQSGWGVGGEQQPGTHCPAVDRVTCDQIEHQVRSGGNGVDHARPVGVSVGYPSERIGGAVRIATARFLRSGGKRLALYHMQDKLSLALTASEHGRAERLPFVMIRIGHCWRIRLGQRQRLHKRRSQWRQ